MPGDEYGYGQMGYDLMKVRQARPPVFAFSGVWAVLLGTFIWILGGSNHRADAIFGLVAQEFDLNF